MAGGNRSEMQQVLSATCHEDQAIDLLQGLVSFPSVSGEEKGVGDYIASVLRSTGCEVASQVIDGDRRNVIGLIQGGHAGKRFVLNTHMDVVPAGEHWTTDPFHLMVRDGRAYGRGACDAKGSLAAMLMAMDALSTMATKIHGSVAFAAVVDEEEGSMGARQLGPWLAADGCIIGEPTSLRIGLAHRGSFRPVVVAHGRSAHSATPSLGINAVRGAMEFLSELAGYEQTISQLAHPLVGTPSVAVTRIRGGEQVNMIPDRCEMVIDRRMIPGEKIVGIRNDLVKMMGVVEHRLPGVRLEIAGEAPTTGGPSETDGRDEYVQMTSEAFRAVLGATPEITGLNGNCDMVHFREAKTPSIIFGPGSLDVAHQPDEYVDVSDVVVAAQCYAVAALSILEDGLFA